MSDIDLKALRKCGKVKRTRIDLTGQMFGRLTAVEFAGIDLAYRASWKCRCDCGKEVVVTSSRLRTGNTQSCGCLRSDRASAAARTTAVRIRDEKRALLDRLEAAESSAASIASSSLALVQRAETAERERDALRKGVAPDLDHVIKWLANGCSVPHAIEELSIYKARIDAAMSQDAGAEAASEPAPRGVDAGAEGGAEQPAPMSVYAWAVAGLAQPFFGEFAEQDARAESQRVGGTAEAFPLFRGVAQEGGK